MRFVPNHTVSYNGSFYKSGQEIDIDPKDAEEMSKHGTVMYDNNNNKKADVQAESEKAESVPTVEGEDELVKAAAEAQKVVTRRGGRPKRT